MVITVRVLMGAAIAALLAFVPAVGAWEKHQILVPAILSDRRDNLPSKPLPSPYANEIFLKIAADLKLNPKITGKSHRKELTPYEILTGPAVDEPDFGMDEDLDDSPGNIYDPKDERPWMGGYHGPTSKGFRHMYFGGIRFPHALRTFQLPPYAVGQAPDRLEAIALKARELLRSTDAVDKAWGFRLLAWAIHYAQDLTQPFHTVQILILKIVPWGEILAWPPTRAFHSLRSEATRIIANYHWAFEDYVYLRLSRTDSLSSCLRQPSSLNVKGLTPKEFALTLAQRSVRLGHDLGQNVMNFFGSDLKNPGVDLPRNLGKPDYAAMAVNPELAKEREMLERTTCEALADAGVATRWLIDWALQP